jgi:hypothetical protein
MHACHFYSNRDELIGALVPYFLTGLSGKERCPVVRELGRIKETRRVQLWLKEEARELADGYNGLRIVALCSYALRQRNDQLMSEIPHVHHLALQGSDADRQWVTTPQFPGRSETGLY